MKMEVPCQTGGVVTIIVADDDGAIRRLTAHVLRDRGHQVLEAANGVEALRTAERHPGPVHLLLTDVQMPELDGPSAWRLLSRQRPEAKVLFMSGAQESVVEFNGALLRKPFALSELARRVEAAL
jgi:two-component system cell cycle sensor histidine kinase/response regulator CckA